MRRLINLVLLIALTLTLSATASARQQSPSHSSSCCSGAVSWQTARNLVGRSATVKGRVVGTKFASSSNGSPTFLDIGANYPSAKRVTVVIWIENRGKFGVPEARYKGHTICVHGYVGEYAGAPEIEATAPSQIFVTQ